MPSPKSKRKQAVKAKLMYATGPGANCPTLFLNPTGGSSNAVATWLIPADRYEDSVEQIAQLSADFYWCEKNAAIGFLDRRRARKYLACLGIKPLTPTKGSRV